MSSLTGRTAGGAYAGATAGNGVGASAAIGGGLDGEGGYGGSGAEAHAAGVSKKVVKLSQAEIAQPPQTVCFPNFTDYRFCHWFLCIFSVDRCQRKSSGHRAIRFPIGVWVRWNRRGKTSSATAGSLCAKSEAQASSTQGKRTQFSLAW